MPAPNLQSEPTSRAINTSECGAWAKLLLGNVDLGERRITSHSCKATILSYLAKHGQSWDDRLVLGGHVGNMKMAMTYSRDSLARPLKVLETVLADICNNKFCPDNTRSGRFADAVDCITIKDEPVEFEVIPDACNESSSAHVTTSSSSGESCAPEDARMVVFTPPVPPVGFHMAQRRKLKTIHLRQDGHKRVLYCGRFAGMFHEDPVSIRYDTPKCRQCWYR